MANGDVIGSQVLKFLLSPQYIVSVDCCDLCRKKEKQLVDTIDMIAQQRSRRCDCCGLEIVSRTKLLKNS